MNLFEHTDTYPCKAGYKTGGASQEAAEMMDSTGKREITVDLVLAFLKAGNVCTSETIAEQINRKHGDTKSRLSELLKVGLVEKLEQRGQGSCGIAIHKWRIA